MAAEDAFYKWRKDMNNEQQRKNVNDELQEYVRLYRDWELNIFPAGPKLKKPLLEWKEFQDRKATDEEVAEWFNWIGKQDYPPNIMVICGKTSNNLIVIDVDDPKTWKKFREEWAKKFGVSVEEYTFVTEGRRGGHVYLCLPYTIEGIKHLEKWNVDIISQNGYVIAPPSDHPLGVEYREIYRTKIKKFDGDIIETVFSILQQIFKDFNPDKIRQTVDVDTLLEGITEGGRNDAAIKLATWMRTGNLTKEETLAKITDWNKKNKPPLNSNEINRTVESAYSPDEPYNYKFSRLYEPIQELTPEIEEFLKSPELYNNIIKVLDFRIVGERELKALIYFKSVGAPIHDAPHGIIVISSKYGSGKSHVTEQTLKVLPEERVKQPTSLSAKSLNYIEQEMHGRTWRIDEIYGMEEGMNDLRVLMSNGRLERQIVEKDERERLGIKELIVEGCPVFITTTTQHVRDELASRNWICGIDTSRKQTKRILKRQHALRMISKKKLEKHIKRIESLQTVSRYIMQNTKPVRQPFIFSFPIDEARSRRDMGKLLQLLDCVTNVFMLQRETIIEDNQEFIVATKEDFELALKISAPFLEQTVTSLDSEQMAIWNYLKKDNEYCSYSDVAKALNLSRVMVLRRVKDMEEKGFVSIDVSERIHRFSATDKEASTLDIRIIDNAKWLKKGMELEDIELEIEKSMDKFDKATKKVKKPKADKKQGFTQGVIDIDS